MISNVYRHRVRCIYPMTVVMDRMYVLESSLISPLCCYMYVVCLEDCELPLVILAIEIGTNLTSPMRTRKRIKRYLSTLRGTSFPALSDGDTGNTIMGRISSGFSIHITKIDSGCIYELRCGTRDEFATLERRYSSLVAPKISSGPGTLYARICTSSFAAEVSALGSRFRTMRL